MKFIPYNKNEQWYTERPLYVFGNCVTPNIKQFQLIGDYNFN